MMTLFKGTDHLSYHEASEIDQMAHLDGETGMWDIFLP